MRRRNEIRAAHTMYVVRQNWYIMVNKWKINKNLCEWAAAHILIDSAFGYWLLLGLIGQNIRSAMNFSTFFFGFEENHIAILLCCYCCNNRLISHYSHFIQKKIIHMNIKWKKKTKQSNFLHFFFNENKSSKMMRSKREREKKNVMRNLNSYFFE